MDGFDCVCTFNGRTFDMPLLEARFTMARMRHRWRELENLDLLPPARRTWKLRLGSCRLARVEELALGMPRGDDLPGSETPKRFFEYLRTGDLSPLDAVVEHNRQDIASLATLLVRLTEIYAEPEKLSERRDQYSVGRALERQGELGPARALYRVSAVPAPAGTLAALTGDRVAGMANWRLFLIARRSGDVEGMRCTLEQMVARGQMLLEAHTELAKLYEHRLHDIGRALDHARQARDSAPPGRPNRSTIESPGSRQSASERQRRSRPRGANRRAARGCGKSAGRRIEPRGFSPRGRAVAVNAQRPARSRSHIGRAMRRDPEAFPAACGFRHSVQAASAGNHGWAMH